jgi:hypothetical protein
MIKPHKPGGVEMKSDVPYRKTAIIVGVLNSIGTVTGVPSGVLGPVPSGSLKTGVTLIS